MKGRTRHKPGFQEEQFTGTGGSRTQGDWIFGGWGDVADTVICRKAGAEEIVPGHTTSSAAALSFLSLQRRGRDTWRDDSVNH